MKYATFGADGRLNGRYDSDFHVEIPAGAVVLDDEAWHRTINEFDGEWSWVNGALVKGPFVIPVVDAKEAALAALVAIDLASIRALREYIAAKPDAPQYIKNHEAAALAERAKLK